MESVKIACGAFLYFEKVFNAVNRKIVLVKPEHHGIRELPLNFPRTYLTERIQYTVVNDSESWNLSIKNTVFKYI